MATVAFPLAGDLVHCQDRNTEDVLQAPLCHMRVSVDDLRSDDFCLQDKLSECSTLEQQPDISVPKGILLSPGLQRQARFDVDA
jgi:hypothetical protein